jgi:hypothetical protein
MTYARKTLSEIKLIHGDFGNFIKGQKLDKRKEKKYKTPPYKDLAASNEIDGEPLDEKCWPGYEKKGMKTMFGKRYPNCVKKKKTRKEEFSDWRSELDVDEATLTKSQIKKRDEIADAISDKEMKDRYGDKNVKYAIATNLVKKEDYLPEVLDKKDVPHVKKLVKKLRDGSKTHAKQADELEVALNTENTAIESELVIQDWNTDDIKFTEIETVDIIKAKPLKESNDELDEKFKFLKHAFGKSVILGTGADKLMGKYPRLSSKGVKSLIKNKSQLAIKGFKNAIEKVKNLKNLDAPTKFPRDKQIIKIKKKISPNAIFPTKANVKIKNEIISDTGISNKNPIKKKFNKDIKDHYDWRADLGEDWQKVNRKDKTDGLSKAAVKAYRRENPGSKLQTAVTKDPKKLKKGSKSAKRRLSFCRRMKGMKKKLTSAKTRRDPNSRINKALRRWNC